MDAFALLEKATAIKPAPLFVLSGDEDFLRRQVSARLVRDLLGDSDPAFSISSFEGEKADWSTVKSELDTLPFLSPRRVVVVEQADPFVTRFRGQLEQYATAPSQNGTLILEVKSWPSNTRLAKATPDSATISCKAPGEAKLIAWCRKWLKDQYGKEFTGDAAEYLVSVAEPSLGRLDQELAKLAAFVGKATSITREHVEQLVGRTREAETFKIFDAIGSGRTADALTILQRLFQQGEEALQILGTFSWQMRRLAAVSRLARTGMPLNMAMERAGVQPWARGGMEQQLRHLGKARMDKIYDWLLENDLGLKGSSQLPGSLLLERLVVQLSRPAPRS